MLNAFRMRMAKDSDGGGEDQILHGLEPRRISADSTNPRIFLNVTKDNLLRLTRAGLLTAVSDGLFASVLSVFFFDSTLSRLWQGVASTLLGKAAFDGGTRTALI